MSTRAPLAELLVIGINHGTAPVEIRERAALATEQFHDVIGALRQQASELAVLSTCNRSEWILLAPTDRHAACAACLRAATGLSAEDFTRHAYLRTGSAALHHLCRVGAGLDSLVPGEPQILGQLKAAFEEAFESELSGAGLAVVYRQVLRVARAVRRATAIAEGATSFGSLALRVARETFPDLESRQVLLIGAGKMARLVGRHVAEAGIARIRVLNRDRERGQALAASLGAEQAPMNDLVASLAWADVVVSSTACPHAFITAEMLQAIAAERGGRPWCIVDLAVPRDVEPEAGHLPGVRLYNIDGLRGLADLHREQRREDFDAAEALVTAMVDEYGRERRVDIGPVVQDLRQQAGAIQGEELERLFRRFGQWSDDEREQISQSVRLVVNRLLHPPLRGLRRLAAGDIAGDAPPTDLFRQLFDLDVPAAQ